MSIIPAMNIETPFAKLIDDLNMNDYEIARRVGVARTTIRSLRIGQNSEPGFTLGIRLAMLSGRPTKPLEDLAKTEPAGCG
jgi:DNA-binding XRE family transcriptional regulator